MARQNLIGAQICDGVNANPAKISIVQIWNPVDSGVNFFVEMIGTAWNASSAVQAALSNMMGWDLNFGDEMLGDGVEGNPVRWLVDKDASNVTPSAIQMRNKLSATPYPAFRLIGEHWRAKMKDTTFRRFTSPLLLPPGYGLQVRPSNPNVYNIVDVEGYTEPVVG